MTAPRFTITGSDAEGWTVRLVAGNGEVVLSSSSQVYADERDAQRAVEIAREAADADRQQIKALIEASSLGTPGAKAARESVPRGVGIAIAAAARHMARADAAERRLAELEAAVKALIDTPDDTQWWEVVPYMDPPEQDEVVEVQIVAVDRLRALLDAAEGGEEVSEG